ncbi:MAG: hypothetical protein JWP58_2071 [Hymenobacter sp.]|nr:hypothetical protein [Hymenobacter sp.]
MNEPKTTTVKARITPTQAAKLQATGLTTSKALRALIDAVQGPTAAPAT